MTTAKRHAPATARNRDPILAVLRNALPDKGMVLEIASGTGEHAAYFAPRLSPMIQWQPSDYDAGNLTGIDAHAAESGCESILPARRIDVTEADWGADLTPAAIFCANMIHIAPWEAGLGLLSGAGRLLPVGGSLILYGPYRRQGLHTAVSNEDFDAMLRGRDVRWGIRDLDGEVLPAAAAVGLALAEIVAMPANNMIVILKKDEAAG